MKSTVTDVKKVKKPVVLLILDGWGLSPSWGGNAIALNQPDNMDYLWRSYPHQVLQAFRKVADPAGKVGSSEIGHATIGSGRIVKQDLTEISLAIGNGIFYENPNFKKAFEVTKQHNGAVHLMGLLSDGGIHGMNDHAKALVELAKRQGMSEVWVHVFTDGRDVDSQSALKYIHDFESHLEGAGLGKIATVIGRWYAMDRDGRWDRIRAAYEALVYGKGRATETAEAAVSTAYRDGYNDEHIPPTIVYKVTGDRSQGIEKTPKYLPGRIKDGDLVIFWNFRADRARQLTQAFCDKKVLRRFGLFREFALPNISFVSMTDYRLGLDSVIAAFPNAVLDNTLPELLVNHGLTQLHVAESEKYAHVTYFFNGGREEPFKGEDRVIVPSPKVENYDVIPKMSAPQITHVLENDIRNKRYDFIVANYANVDMMGHTGNLIATGDAVKVVDEAVRRVANAVLDVDGILMITADHGNAEQVVTLNQGDRETLHTLNPVPFILVSKDSFKGENSQKVWPQANSILPQIVKSPYTLADVAPTVLEVMGIAKPSDMTGESLIGKME